MLVTVECGDGNDFQELTMREALAVASQKQLVVSPFCNARSSGHLACRSVAMNIGLWVELILCNVLLECGFCLLCEVLPPQYSQRS